MHGKERNRDKNRNIADKKDRNGKEKINKAHNGEKINIFNRTNLKKKRRKKKKDRQKVNLIFSMRKFLSGNLNGIFSNSSLMHKERFREGECEN